MCEDPSLPRHDGRILIAVVVFMLGSLLLSDFYDGV